MAKPYQSRIADSKEAMILNNETPGAKAIVYFLKPNGFKISVNGCTFREVVLCTTDRKSGAYKEQELVEAELVNPDGTRSWEYKGIRGWQTLAHNGHAIAALVKGINEGQKARSEARLAGVMEQVKTMKLANVPSYAIVAALKSQGLDSVAAEQLVKATVAETQVGAEDESSDVE